MNKMRWNKLRIASLIGLCLLLLAAAGCQAVGGADLNGAIVKSLTTESYESKGSMTLKVNFSRFAFEGLSAREQSALKLLEELTVRIDSWIIQDGKNQSLDGALLVGARSIGFSVQIDEKQAVLRMDGLKKPMVLDLSAAQKDMGYTDSTAAFSGLLGGSVDPVQSALIGQELIDKAGGFWIAKLPNPKRLGVQSVSDAVYGGGQASWKVTTEWQGLELWSWVKTYIGALLSDPKGMTESLNALYDVLLAHPEVGATDEDGNPLKASDKKTLVGDAVDSITSGLQSGLSSMNEAEKDASLKEIFTPSSSLKAELLLDSSLHIRSMNAIAVWQPDASTMEKQQLPVKRVSLQFNRDLWHINEAPAAKKPEAGVDSWTAERWGGAPSYRIMQDFDKSSVAYQILKKSCRQDVNLSSTTPSAPNLHYDPIGLIACALRGTVEQMGGQIPTTPPAKNGKYPTPLQAKRYGSKLAAEPLE